MGQGLPSYTEPTNAGNFFTRAWFKFFSSLWPPQGQGNATFGSGYIQYAAPQGGVTADINFEVGTKIPNPSGTPGPALLLGSGGGNGTAAQAWILTDQAYDSSTPGNLLGITAGETQPAGTADGGELFLVGGGSFGGTGGTLQLQGGTSYNGAGGLAVLQGGNATQAGDVPGDVFVIAGEVGNAGANVHLVSTTLSSTPGVVRIANGSDITHTSIMIDFVPVGAPSGGAQPMAIYIYGGGGFGTSGQSLKSGGPGAAVYWG